jgi:hypothetical protein
LALAAISANAPAPARALDEAPVPEASGQAAPSPAPSAVPLDPGFLLLPAKDVERLPGKNEQAQKAQAKPLVGDSFELRVVGADPSLKVDAPPGGESLNDQGWEIEPGADGRFSATAVKPGTLTLPSLALKDATGKIVARTNSITIEVQSAIKSDDPKPEEAVDIRPPVALQFPWWVLVVAGLALIGLGVVSYHFMRKYLAGRKPKAPPEPQAPPKTEDEIALEALALLDRHGYARRGEFKKYYFGVSETLKAYVGARFGFDAPESTSREMIAHLEEGKIVGDQWIDRLETMFERLDRVKFTDHVPEGDEPARLIEDARQFVLATRRPPAVTTPPGAAQPGAPASSVEVRGAP